MMRTWILSLLVLLSGCAHMEQPPVPAGQVAALLNDAAFAAPARPVDAAGLFDLSPDMRRHLASAPFQALLRQHGQTLGLIQALYDARELQLDYDSSYTGNAAETYAARKGNCLSLVIMTAAFARALELDVRFQDVQIEDTWSRDHALYLVSSHVNLSLAPRAPRTDDYDASSLLTVDFVPGMASSRQRVRYLSETDIVALYMNNRAAEELAQGRQSEAYWWARGALLKKPTLAAAYNTLAVIYQRSGQTVLAEQVYRAALEREPDSLVVLQNLAPLLAANGKTAEAEQLTQRAARLYPAPPYHFFNQAMEAYKAGNIVQARTLFAREVARAPYNDEFHFWLGVANFELGELGTAEKQLALARDTSVHGDVRERYSAKLAHLRSIAGGQGRN
jgi:Tfp pilus assembly protein PilF